MVAVFVFAISSWSHSIMGNFRLPGLVRGEDNASLLIKGAAHRLCQTVHCEWFVDDAQDSLFPRLP